MWPGHQVHISAAPAFFVNGVNLPGSGGRGRGSPEAGGRACPRRTWWSSCSAGAAS
jgi:hypothetical protein